MTGYAVCCVAMLCSIFAGAARPKEGQLPALEEHLLPLLFEAARGQLQNRFMREIHQDDEHIDLFYTDLAGATRKNWRKYRTGGGPLIGTNGALTPPSLQFPAQLDHNQLDDILLQESSTLSPEEMQAAQQMIKKEGISIVEAKASDQKLFMEEVKVCQVDVSCCICNGTSAVEALETVASALAKGDGFAMKAMKGRGLAAFTYSMVQDGRLHVEYQCQRSTHALCVNASETSGELSFVQSLLEAVKHKHATEAEIRNVDSVNSAARALFSKYLFFQLDTLEEEAIKPMFQDMAVWARPDPTKSMFNGMLVFTVKHLPDLIQGKEPDLKITAPHASKGGDEEFVNWDDPNITEKLQDPASFTSFTQPGGVYLPHL
jgi:hypothetical protein